MKPSRAVRVGAVAYLNARPLVFGFEQGVGGERIELSHDVPAVLADRLARGELDIGLIPSVELGRIPDLEIVPGIAIGSRGPARSVFVMSRGAPQDARRVALDPESRTSNALARILFSDLWNAHPEFAVGPADLRACLEDHDAAVRIGDKALFESPPEGVTAIDLGEAWDRAMGLPFVYAVWACRPGALDDALYRLFHESRRRGMRFLDAIADDYTWRGRQYAVVAREYLGRHIRYRLGSAEIRGLKAFLSAAARLGLLPAEPEIRLALGRWSACHETARGVLHGESRG